VTLLALLLPAVLAAAPLREAQAVPRLPDVQLPQAAVFDAPAAAGLAPQAVLMAAPDGGAPNVPPSAGGSGGPSAGLEPEASRPGLLGRAQAMADYLLRRSNRESALNASSMLLGVRDYHSLPSQSRERTVEAVNTLRGFRLSIGQSTAEPGFRSRLVAVSGGSSRAAKAAAAQIRGIERHGMKSENGVENPDSRQRHVLGVAVSGREAIEAFNADVERNGATLRRQLDVQPYLFHRINRLLRAFTSPLSLGTAPAFLFLGVNPVHFALGVAGLTIVNEPLSVFRNHWGKDRWFRAGRRRAADFLAKGERWVFESKTYALQGDLVDTLLRAGKNEEALRMPLWNQDFHGSHGLFSRLTKLKLYRRQAAGDAQLLAEMRNGETDRWVTVDRLLWRKPGAEPVMVVTVRTSSTRPKFPKPATEKSPAFSWAPAPQPIAVPVPARPGRRS